MNSEDTILDKPESPKSNFRLRVLFFVGIGICVVGVACHFFHLSFPGALLVTCGLVMLHIRSTIIFSEQKPKQLVHYAFFAGRTLLVISIALTFWHVRLTWLLVATGVCYALGIFAPELKEDSSGADDY